MNLFDLLPQEHKNAPDAEPPKFWPPHGTVIKRDDGTLAVIDWSLADQSYPPINDIPDQSGLT